MEKTKKVLFQLFFWFAIGIAIKMLWNNTMTKGTAVAEKYVGTPVTNVVRVDGIDPVIKDSK
jgi:hypothetical protein